MRKATLLVELANADGQLDRLKNRKRSRKRSRTVDLMTPIRRDLLTWRQESGAPDDGALVFPHEVHGRLWFADEYRNWRRRVYGPSAEAVGLPSRRPYDLRHTWASLLIDDYLLRRCVADPAAASRLPLGQALQDLFPDALHRRAAEHIRAHATDPTAGLAEDDYELVSFITRLLTEPVEASSGT